MTSHETSHVPIPLEADRATDQHLWALGDYHRFATSTVWQLGPVLVEACRIAAGQHVLDVAAGTGNVAIRAAKTGASVVASDITPAHFDVGRQAAAGEGVELEWREADVQALPFDDASFDVVTSCFGAIFATDHGAVARELLRVCRRGGTIGLTSFVPDGAGGDFFELVGRYAPPPPPGARSPLLWGEESYVRKLLGSGLASLEIAKRTYEETAPSARDYCALFREAFGPVIALRASLADRPARLSEFDREFEAFVARWNRGTGGRVDVPYGYLLIVARKGR